EQRRGRRGEDGRGGPEVGHRDVVVEGLVRLGRHPDQHRATRLHLHRARHDVLVGLVPRRQDEGTSTPGRRGEEYRIALRMPSELYTPSRSVAWSWRRSTDL